jgi:8-oxo-dGTP diphosphatase
MNRREARQFASQVISIYQKNSAEAQNEVVEILNGNRDDYLKINAFPIVEHPRNPPLTVDAIIDVTIRQVSGVLVIHRKNPPYGLALPGGFVDYGESVEDAVRREVREETSLNVTMAEQFHVYSKPDRDPRQHNASVVFYCRVEGTPKAADDAASLDVVEWENIEKMEFAFDHKWILLDYKRGKK